jgi:hypothetical protein
VAVVHALRKLAATVKAHRKSLGDVEPVDAGGQEVLNAIDTLLEIQEMNLDAKIAQLVQAQQQTTDDRYLAKLERSTKRAPRHWSH